MPSTLLTPQMWTFDDLQALDLDDWRRYEIVDGALVVSPSPAAMHDWIAAQLVRVVSPAIPVGFDLTLTLAVDIAPTYFVPDLVVVPRSVIVANRSRVTPADVRLAIEVMSPGSVTMDRIVKPARYAAAGIPAYWRVETDPMSLTAYVLRDGAYTEVGTWHAGETAEIEAPFAVRIAMDRLVP